MIQPERATASTPVPVAQRVSSKLAAMDRQSRKPVFFFISDSSLCQLGSVSKHRRAESPIRRRPQRQAVPQGIEPRSNPIGLNQPVCWITIIRLGRKPDLEKCCPKKTGKAGPGALEEFQLSLFVISGDLV